MGKQAGRRWTYYRLGSLSHNVPVIDGSNQNLDARAKMLEFKSEPAGGSVAVDMTTAYAPKLSKALRRAGLSGGRKAAFVRDELTVARPCKIAWGLTTDAEVKIDGNVAMLSLNGKTMRVTFELPAGAKLAVLSAQREAPEKTNAGVRRIEATWQAKAGAVTIGATFEPVAQPEGQRR